MKFNIKTLVTLPLVALALGGCSSDEPGAGAEAENGGLYIAFAISAPVGDPGVSRAYEFGGGNENRVDHIDIYFFDALGRATREPARLEGAEYNTFPSGNNVATKFISEAYLVQGLSTTDILAVANADMFPMESTLDDICNTIRTYASEVSLAPDFFVMSSTAYLGTGGKVRTAKVETTDMYRSAQEALNNPVDVYIERTLARVDVNCSVGVTLDKTNTADGAALSVSIDGIAVAHSKNRYPLVKGIAQGWASYSDFSINDDHRSFWADDNYGLAADFALSEANYSYAGSPTWQISNNGAQDFLNYTYNHGVGFNSGTATLYTSENTTSYPTKILLKGHVRVNGVNTTVVNWGGIIYKASDFINNYVTMLNDDGFRRLDGDTYRNIVASDLSWYTGAEHFNLITSNRIKAYENTVRVAAGSYRRILPGNVQDMNETAVNNHLLGDKYKVWYYKDGATYYFTDIRSGLGDDKGVRSRGVVRNHLYRINVQSIRGLGTPVPDPDELIIPQNPEERAFYLGVYIQSLQWNRITQGGDFNGEPI